MLKRCRLLVALLLVQLAGPIAVAADELEGLKSGRHILIMRHALAPGTGDPDNFKLDECSTQRNLSDDGRAQARAIGERLRAAGITDARVYSSQWCRCLETAELLGLGPVEPLPALNSFFGRANERDERNRALGAFLQSLGTDTDRPVILVTHQVNISALTGQGTASGEALLLALDGTPAPAVVGGLD